MDLRCIVLPLFLAPGLFANEAVDRAHQYEDVGDSAMVRDVYSKALDASPRDPELLNAYAQTLERYRDPGAREAYRKSAVLWKSAGRAPDALAAERRAVLLDLIAGDHAAAERDLGEYRSLGGRDLQPAGSAAAAAKRETILIPGPLHSFARMAAISPDADVNDVLPALARNVVTNGYQASHANELLEETEYLKLVRRYLAQARELDKLTGPDKFLRITNCESTQTNDLLRTLGYRMRGACGGELVLETVNAPRAFITTDSGFPLAELEQALRTEQPFSYDYHPASAAILYTSDYWLNVRERQGDFIDAFLGDPALCRFYLGMAKLDPETAETLKNNVSAARLRANAAVLDFFGGNFEIRQGKALIPGGARATSGWADLAGVSPDKGSEFFDKLMSKDDGWLAGLYDSLARIQGPVQDYLTEPARMKRLYSAVRGRVTTPGPARPVFRSNTEMMLLTTRLHINPDGRVHIPGDLDVWRQLFEKNPRGKGKYDAKLSRAAVNWKDPDDVIEALFALCRKPADNEPLRMFMAIGDIDRNRAQPLRPETVQRMIRAWNIYGAQYSTFNDAPTLSDKTIVAWLDAAEAIDKTRDPLFRMDVVGTMQGLTGIWQIFCRQGSIAPAKADETLAALTAPFAAVKNTRDLFDAGRAGIDTLLKNTAAKAGANAKETAHDRMLALLAGGPRPDDSDSRAELVLQERRIFEAQKLLPVDFLFDLADNLQAVTKGEKLSAPLAQRLAARVADIQLPRSSMSGVEKNTMAAGFFVDKHVDDERKLNLRAIIDKAAKDPERLKDIRGQLAPTLRDTIVGYNYLHYAPPGAQILVTNPLFVRGHDFIGVTEGNHSWRTTQVFGTGWPTNAGGRLTGSLSGLPYALASAEQNFLVPSQTQALIWSDLAPEMILVSRTARFWTVTPAQMHWVGMHMRLAEDMIAEATADPAVRGELTQAVDRVANPLRAALVLRLIAEGDARGAIDAMTPSEMYTMAAANTTARGIDLHGSPEVAEIGHFKSLVPDQVSETAISRAWGTAKPTLANSYRPELLNLRTFPSLMGFSSRILAESWESNLLYWADVGDQTGVQPAQLNVLVPEWTGKVVERIFASHLEDWPALLKSLRSVGEEVRTQNTQVAAANSARPDIAP